MSLLYLVLGMTIVTYIPRMLPFVLLQNVSLPKNIKRFMEFIPYAALGALIFPGVLHSTGVNNVDAAIVGCIMSILLAIFEFGLILIVVGGIVGVFIMNVFFP